AGGGRAGRPARAALAPQRRRVAVLPRRARAHDRVRLERQGADLRLPGRRRRLRPVRDGALCREHRRRTAALPGDVPESLLRRPVAEPGDAPDPAGTRARSPEPGRTGHGRPAQGQAGDRSGSDRGKVLSKATSSTEEPLTPTLPVEFVSRRCRLLRTWPTRTLSARGRTSSRHPWPAAKKRYLTRTSWRRQTI